MLLGTNILRKKENVSEREVVSIKKKEVVRTLSVEKEETGNIQGRQGFGKQMFSMHFSPPKSLEC